MITARPRRAGLGEHMRTLSISGRIVRVAVRDGNPDWPPLLYHGGHLELATRAERMAPVVEAFLTAEESPG